MQKDRTTSLYIEVVIAANLRVFAEIRLLGCVMDYGLFSNNSVRISNTIASDIKKKNGLSHNSREATKHILH